MGSLFARAFLSALMVVGAAVAALADASSTTATTPISVATPADYDVASRVLSEPQRKLLDRDPRCRDARAATDAYVASAGKALQTGVDAMIALEKCASLGRVGADWADYRDYAITAAAALAYAVGASAGDERLLRRALDDAAQVTGYSASSMTVETYNRAQGANNGFDSNAGHQSGEGPPQATLGYVHESRHVAAESHAYGVLATNIGAAATASLGALKTTRVQKP